ncbi:hypothetical protein VOLCADRAFT_61255 [Volvox carteri f. nagariensis]|uniref:Peptidyl-prolyl cis-trans isomerase n=1 Tax=Volvox carteri f. nagariensis TaxID=3068 RepID=D8TYA7_VOLCA|nr:uncharacterized protein VOLCADRAFT_61255 [Volvox carteri f. nagariensis]EFJ47518.1 hypothetical protein VOLCADRAFT_61255 [Volvox carteri f. nagariensis]|eukprot:XP_002951342.1 hypothetical protein VOLCADRAFT_61255 [Volvox carteri f. nagariensis]
MLPPIRSPLRRTNEQPIGSPLWARRSGIPPCAVCPILVSIAILITNISICAVAAQYGLSGKPEELDADAATLLREAYSSDPTWASKGEVSTAKPAPIRAGRIVLELFDKEVPKTVENFRCLLTGEKGLGKASKKPLHYKGSKFHRIVRGFCCQGGDIVRGDGSGGDSIFGGQFNDEKPGLKLKHDGPGILSMANSGKNTNTSQFFFTLAAAPQCDGKHVVFGKVVEGLDILARIDSEAASPDGSPRVDVTIADCGTC